MNKLGIWAIAIVGAFVIGILSANPVVEAVGGWKAAVIELNDDISDIELFLEERSDFWEFLEESGEEFFESQIYEVSGVSVIPAGETFGNRVSLRCLDGDWYLSEPTRFTMTIDPSIVETFAVGIGPGNTSPVAEGNPGTAGSKVVGFATTPRNDGVKPPFAIPVTITGLCVSPSP